MKNVFFTAVIFTGICCSKTILAQRLTDAQIADKINTISLVFNQYQKDIDNNVIKGQDLGKTKKKITKMQCNPKMMNVFLANNIGNRLSSSKDISLQKHYAILEQGDGTLFIGYNLDFRQNKLERLKHILNVGIKNDFNDNFSSLVSDGKLNNRLAINLKHNYIFKGEMFNSEEQKKMVKDYRNAYLKKKYEDELNKYNSEDVASNKEENTDLEIKLKRVKTFTDIEKIRMIEKEFNDQYEKIATEEEKFITDYKLYKFAISKWITTEIYFPLGRQNYAISPDVSVFNTTDERFYDFKASFLYSVLVKKNDKNALLFNAGISAFNNNNILTKQLTAYKFETIVNQGGSNQTVADSKDAYVGNYQAGFSGSIKSELTYFFVQDIVGISIAGEQVAGNFNARNWKFAIPFSLKDKDNKPSVNFELQFKEVSKTHYFGISVGYAFGKFLN